MAEKERKCERRSSHKKGNNKLRGQGGLRRPVTPVALLLIRGISPGEELSDRSLGLAGRLGTLKRGSVMSDRCRRVSGQGLVETERESSKMESLNQFS